MPSFELLLLLKKLPEPQLKSALRRTARYIFETGGVLRTMQNLGLKQCPYKIRGPNGLFKEANYFLCIFDTATIQTRMLREKLRLDVDVVRERIHFVEDKLNVKITEQVPECTIEIDMLDVPFRPHVNKLIELSNKVTPKREFVYGGNRNHDPLTN